MEQERKSVSIQTLEERIRSLEKELAKIRQQCDSYRLMAEGANDGLWFWDLKEDRYVVSERDRNVFAYQTELDCLSINDWKDLIHPEDREKASQMLSGFIQYGQGMYENIYRLRGKDGRYRWVLSRGVAQKNTQGSILCMAGSHTDISQQVQLDNKLYQMAYYDSLTRLANAEKLKECFEIEKDKRIDRNMALLYFDIDNFSYINNTMGYGIGNEMIKKTASLLKDRYGHDHYVARTSADEFVILMMDYGTIEQLSAEIDQFLIDASGVSFFEKQEVHLTFSVGISLYREHGTEYYQLVQKANTALFCAKRNGKDQQMIYDEEMESYAYHYIDTIQQIRYGIEHKEFEVFYQPIVEANTAKLDGLEALLRWQHPFRGCVAPGNFIVDAERSGQILQIEKWVIERVFEQCRQWLKTGEMPRVVSVNLSARGLLERDVVAFMKKMLNWHQIDPGRIELEITETALLEGIEEALQVIGQLKELGFRMALDDFGTGYSSLNYLNRLPIDRLKLDKSFVDSVEKAGKDRMMVDAIIGLAHRMGLTVVAEGVESEAQRKVLKELGCDYLQGYYFGKPRPFRTWDEYRAVWHLEK